MITLMPNFGRKHDPYLVLQKDLSLIISILIDWNTGFTPALKQDAS
jgi:hypothetical protein